MTDPATIAELLMKRSPPQVRALRMFGRNPPPGQWGDFQHHTLRALEDAGLTRTGERGNVTLTPLGCDVLAIIDKEPRA